MNNPRLDIGWDLFKAQLNVKKHGMCFAEAATVLFDLLALTVFDAVHSQDE